jgi:hypothetical protein
MWFSIESHCHNHSRPTKVMTGERSLKKNSAKEKELYLPISRECSKVAIRRCGNVGRFPRAERHQKMKKLLKNKTFPTSKNIFRSKVGNF